ncbi:hypothetical protein BDQ94DRAFT_149064 [Aspergillus welwitschiae]|uniref:Uncharacterized protein n=1 Tax=Aspergillus welwitschiae TaxID=1341132 RepID=A0A3F3PU62_9EURO|nr:hypothetical protein BDQ94DRAFT_149064 [Aspergillus welwitschiae]RDH30443.1 hypothetical protein BDQ94DRAFT_149064 [Aspergillus welwitschiae]
MFETSGVLPAVCMEYLASVSYLVSSYCSQFLSWYQTKSTKTRHKCCNWDSFNAHSAMAKWSCELQSAAVFQCSPEYNVEI